MLFTALSYMQTGFSKPRDLGVTAALLPSSGDFLYVFCSLANSAGSLNVYFYFFFKGATTKSKATLWTCLEHCYHHIDV